MVRKLGPNRDSGGSVGLDRQHDSFAGEAAMASPRTLVTAGYRNYGNYSGAWLEGCM